YNSRSGSLDSFFGQRPKELNDASLQVLLSGAEGDLIPRRGSEALDLAHAPAKRTALENETRHEPDPRTQADHGDDALIPPHLGDDGWVDFFAPKEIVQALALQATDWRHERHLGDLWHLSSEEFVPCGR